MAKPNDDRAGQSELLFWLARACRDEREHGSFSASEVAFIAGVSPTTVSRFESNERWPRQLDELLGAYAFLAGLPDARELYAKAIALWHEHGYPPALPKRLSADGGPLADFRRRLGAVPEPHVPPDATARQATRRAPNADKKRLARAE